jgi:hypothetical protein
MYHFLQLINIFSIASTKIVALAILKYTRVKSIQCINSIKILTKNTTNFLEHLKVGKFNEDLKAEKSAIKATPVVIHLKLMEKDTLVTRRTLEIAKKCAAKQETS